ncbi:MAG: alpha/beta hydrolase-fold protein [Burkholderiaceae bacterium]|nr:alpha/beta hydrolase-fold protein [Burkholderiaceae bacterium]
MQHGRVVIETIDSLVLQGNAMGDPALRQMPIYLPPGYEGSTKRFPSAYVLSGFTGRGLMQLNDAWGDETLPQRLDRLICSGRMQPMIVAMPDCLTRVGGSQYINSTATGRYEDYLVQEVVPFIDTHFRTKAERDYRAVLGKSSGGYGAVIQAMRHPEVFGLAASHSGDMYFELCYKPDFVKVAAQIGHFGGLKAFYDNLATIRPRSDTFKIILNTIAMAACYSPNPRALSGVGFELPFDEYSAETNETVWCRWLKWDPTYLVGKHLDSLKSLRLLYIDVGRRDEFNLQFGARIFCRHLQKHGVNFMHEEFDDGHMNISYRYDHSFVAISRAME